jgi:hypothetical protein
VEDALSAAEISSLRSRPLPECQAVSLFKLELPAFRSRNASIDDDILAAE